MTKKGGGSKGGGESTSPRVASIASKGLQNPGSLTKSQIKTIAASVLTQKEKGKK